MPAACGVTSLGSCLLWDPALSQHVWVLLKRKAWEEVILSKLCLQEAGAGMEGLHEANCSGKLLCAFIFFLVQDLGLLLCLGAPWSFREEGRIYAFPYSRDPGRPMASSWAYLGMGEFHTILDPVPAIYRKNSRDLSVCLWDPGVYFDSVVVFGFVLMIFLFLEAEWISPGLCNCCTTFWLCVVQGSAVVSGDVPLKYSYYLSSLHKLHQISIRHFQKLLLIRQLHLQS